MKVVFMGTPEFAIPTLNALAGAHEIVAIYTQPDQPSGRGLELREPAVKRRAKELGISNIFQPEKLKGNDGEFERFRAMGADALVVAAYGQILEKRWLDVARLGALNLHSSLLPRWRGAAPIQRAMLARDPVTGVSVQKIVERLDAGDVLLSEETPIGPRETVSTLHDRLAEMGAPLILRALQGLDQGTLVGVPQDESKVTVAKKLSKELERLNPFVENADELDLKIRVLNPWPGASVATEMGRIKILSARPVHQNPSVGLIEKVGQASVVLGCSDQTGLELLEVKSEGKRAMAALEFWNGCRVDSISVLAE